MPISEKEARFDAFFKEPVYLLYKNNLYNFLRRRSVIRNLLKNSAQGKVLELGCGISPMLDKKAYVFRTDISHEALRYLEATSSNGVRSSACSATELAFLDGAFDQVICSEVLEHVEKDGQALDEIARVLKTGGELILTCPVHSHLFGFDDEFVGHYRRYDIPKLLETLHAKGFTNLQTQPVLGPLEKQIIYPLVQIFAGMKEKNSRGGGGKGIQIIFWILFPFYALANYLLAFLAGLEAERVPLDKAVTLCIRCQKAG